MKFIDLVKKRSSVRKYLSKAVPRNILEKCLEAARLAPSACNSQPWFFIVIDEDETIKKLAEEAFSGIYSMNSFAKKAPCLVAVVRERSTYVACLGGLFRGIQYSLFDIGVACEHFVLQAEEDGVGSCMLGWFNEKAVKKILGISKKNKIDIIISLGYPANVEIRNKKIKSSSEMSRFV